MQTTQTTGKRIPDGTAILNTTDGEPGTIICGLDSGRQGCWWSYIVETAYGREVWPRREFVLLTEIECEQNDSA